MELDRAHRPTGFATRFPRPARRGASIHLAIDVDRLDVLCARLAAAGHPAGRPCGDPRRDGRPAFVHPRDAHGILVQFWEEPEFGSERRR
jgi:hypothetical protein